MNGRAKMAQVQPNARCRAICKGIVQQIQCDREGKFLVAVVRADSGPREAAEESAELLNQVKLAEEPRPSRPGIGI